MKFLGSTLDVVALTASGSVSCASVAVTGAATLSGTATFSNATPIDWRDAGATARRMLNLGSGGAFAVGDMDNAIAGGTLNLFANGLIQNQVNGTTVVSINANGLGIGIAPSVALHIKGLTAETIRFQNDSAFLSSYNTLNTVRTGYLQFIAGSAAVFYAENGASLMLGTNSTERLRISPAGALGIGGTNYGNAGDALISGGSSTLPSWQAQPFDVHAFYPGLPSSSAKVLRVPLARAVSFAANFAGSRFTASANAAATTVFDVQKNGSSIGSISIASGGTTATFTTTSGTLKTFAAGDVLAIIAPATPDTTLTDPGFVLVGTR